jgi:hypothetical protein
MRISSPISSSPWHPKLSSSAAHSMPLEVTNISSPSTRFHSIRCRSAHRSRFHRGSL